MKEDKPLTVSQAGRLGGIKTREAHKDDPDYFKRLGRKGGAATVAKHGSKHFQEIGKAGGQANAEAHDTEHFSNIGTKGGEALRTLIEEGRAADGD